MRWAMTRGCCPPYASPSVRRVHHSSPDRSDVSRSDRSHASGSREGVSSLRPCGSKKPRQDLGRLFPFPCFACELLLAGPRETVILRPSLVVRYAPLGRDVPFLLE